MPGGAQPYIYSPPKQYSALDPYDGFDPKPYTRASFMPPPPPKPKPQGPLLDFNRHPDSYLILPYGKTDAQPMSSNTKTRVTITRRIQLVCRIVEMVGALGLLVCVIAVGNVGGADSYIIRAPPIVDVVTLSYSIYHLSRSVNARVPGSSGSYHFFALILDLGLIPFYGFTALLAHSSLIEAPGNQDRWTSIFHKYLTATPLITTIWIDTLVIGGLHLVSLGLSIYLTYVFYQICQLPPDMNPLEDNLTSRKKMKHKHKNSELSTTSMIHPNDADKIPSPPASGRTSPGKNMAETHVRPVSFLHTRTNSNASYSPHNPATASASRVNLGIPTIPEIYQRVRSPYSIAPDAAKEFPPDAEEEGSERSHTFWSEPSSHLPTMLSGSSVYSDDPPKSSTPPLPRKSSKRRSLLSDNWFIYDGNGRLAGESRSPAVSVVYEEPEERLDKLGFGFGRPDPGKYKPLNQAHIDVEDHDSHLPRNPKSKALTVLTKDNTFDFKPLGMNPPTPPSSRQSHANGHKLQKDRPLSSLSGNESRSTTPTKQKYYGDLTSAMRGIRHNQRDSAIDMGSANNLGVESKDWSQSNGKAQMLNNKERVVSRSGVDIDDSWNGDGSNLRGRNVSGKVAEEGRVGI